MSNGPTFFVGMEWSQTFQPGPRRRVYSHAYTVAGLTQHEELEAQEA